MIGRAAEVSMVDSLVRGAREGRSGALLISGEPGIGKTALLAHARRASAGMPVLEAQGSEAESRLAFAGLAALLGPVLHHMDELPVPQAEALRGALALGPPQPGDRFTVYVATLSLLAAAAEERPLVCIVDDAHWLDTESLEAIQFAARRLGAEGIAILLGARDGANPLTDGSALTRVALSGLGAADARRLVAERASADPAPSVLEALVAGAGGNPLALIELAASLTDAELSGRESLPDPLPVGRYLERALLRALDGLPAATRRALLVASADDGAAEFLVEALRAEGIAMADLEPAERAGVIAVGPLRARFSHPLVRAAIYQAADPPDRRAAHAAHAIAAQGREETGALDRRAWHLALASAGPDEGAATELEQAAERAAARSAYAGAAEALEAAARLSPEVAGRARRLSAAGRNSLAAGRFARAAELFDEVIALSADPHQVIEAMAARGYTETFGGSARRATDMLAAAADRVEHAAPEAAAALLAQASLAAQMRADVREARALAERADPLVDATPGYVRALVDAALASASIFSGLPASLSKETEQQLSEHAATGDPVAYFWAVAILHVRMLEERYDEALSRVDAFVGAARSRSTPSTLPFPLTFRADLLLRRGRLQEARADAAEAAQIAEETGQRGVRGYAYGTLARVEATLGRSEDCRAHAAAGVADVEASEAYSLPIYAGAALGLLALGEGRLDDALAHLVTTHRRYARGGAAHPLLVPFAQDLIETRIRLGRVDEAADGLDELAAQAQALGTPWPKAAVARCRGLMAGETEFEDHFAVAMGLHELTPTPFERARTQLCLGERRRRARRVRAARAPLEAALETFDSIDAAPWSEWTRRELRAAGARPMEARPIAAGALTSQELRVALAVAGGSTNKEIATALLISPKTVEYHLARVFAKLGVRSRSELAGRMARETSHLLPSERPD